MKRRNISPRGEKKVDLCDPRFISLANVTFDRMVVPLENLFDIRKNEISDKIKEEQYTCYEKKINRLKKIETEVDSSINTSKAMDNLIQKQKKSPRAPRSKTPAKK